MYRTVSKTALIENKTVKLFGIAQENEIICLFSEDKDKADYFTRICNENGVERNHILDLIEDMYY